MIGVYYLHTNGNLIYKPAAVFGNSNPQEYFDSDFVVKYWVIPSIAPTDTLEGRTMWTLNWLKEAHKLTSDKLFTEKRINDILDKNKIDRSLFYNLL